MAYNGSGVFLINSTGQPVVSGTVISSTVFNALTADLATGLTDCVTKDGQSTTTAVIPFANGISIGGGATLSNYTQNNWVPVDASGASLVLTVIRATYVRIGSLYFCDLDVTYPVTADVTAAKIGGLPGTWINASGVGGTFAAYNGAVLVGAPIKNTATFTMVSSTGTTIKNSDLSGSTLSTQFVIFTV